MQENKEHHRTGITEAIAEDAIHIMEGDEAIIHDPPESHRLSKTQHTFLTVRNIFVVIAGGLFILSMLHIEPIYHYWNVLKFVAYILGAGAYGAEVIVLTDGWRKTPMADRVRLQKRLAQSMRDTAPTIAAAKGAPQALAWNIGTTGSIVARADRSKTSG